jgi:hypothetical protein
MTGMDKYAVSDKDAWTWSKAGHTDVEDILDLVAENYQHEIFGFMEPNRPRMCYHIHKALLQQLFEQHSVLITQARDNTTNKLLAWAWLERGKYTVYAVEELATAEFAHVDLTLSQRNKVKLIAQILQQWITWCEAWQIPVLTSSSIRADQTAFMRLHEQYGFIIRGSVAYRKIT